MGGVLIPLDSEFEEIRAIYSYILYINENEHPFVSKLVQVGNSMVPTYSTYSYSILNIKVLQQNVNLQTNS